MRALVLVLLASPLGNLSAQQSADEREVRSLIENFDDSKKQAMDDVIFVSGAYPRPIIGRQAAISPSDTAMARRDATVRKRTNQKSRSRVQRVEVSKAGDMAYGFALFDMEFDVPDSTGKKEHVKFEGSQLTVWKKVQGQWRLAAAFNRPNE